MFLCVNLYVLIVDSMSASLNVENGFNFRKLDKRLVVVKTKSAAVRKVAVQDIVSNLMFAVEVPASFDMQSLEVNNEYLFTLKVETSKNVADVDKEFIGFFEAIDVEQSTDDFIRAYWIYPAKIRFELVEAEEP